MEKIEKLIEEIDSLTVVELNDLVKAIEEKYGVSAVVAAASSWSNLRCRRKNIF